MKYRKPKPSKKSEKLYRKVGNEYVACEERFGEHPCEGLWLVKDNGCNRHCITFLEDIPKYDEKILTYLNTKHEKLAKLSSQIFNDEIISYCPAVVADVIIKCLSEKEQKEEKTQ